MVTSTCGSGRPRTSARSRDVSGEPRGEPSRFVVDLASRAARQRLERRDDDAAAFVLPRPATCPSTRKLGNECGVFVSNSSGRKRSGRICVRRAWTSSVASHVGRNRTGAGASASGSGARGRSSSSPPRSSRNRRSVIRSSAGASVVMEMPAQLAMSLRDAGPKAVRYRRASSIDPVVARRRSAMRPANPRRRRRCRRSAAPTCPTAGRAPG